MKLKYRVLGRCLPARLLLLGTAATAQPVLPSAAASQQTDPLLLESVEWYTGVAGRVDNERAAELLREAAADADPLSLMWIARVHSRGRMGFAEDPERARAVASRVIERVEELAAQGEAEALFLMGTAYAEGLGVEVDPEEAVLWYRRAAELGNVLAQHNLGNVHFAGEGVPQSDSLAVEWWLKAASQGDAIPALRLGTMYEDGRGVTRDLAEARRWYGESASRGNQAAEEALQRLESR
jgi:TPR repeat protein